jgi:hypothetical protein
MSPQRHQSTNRILLHFVPVECYTAPAFVADRNGEMNHRFATMDFLLHIAHYRRQSTCLFGRRLRNSLCRLACEAWTSRLADKSSQQPSSHQRLIYLYLSMLAIDRSAIMQSIKSNTSRAGRSGSASFYLDGHLGSSLAFHHSSKSLIPDSRALSSEL